MGAELPAKSDELTEVDRLRQDLLVHYWQLEALTNLYAMVPVDAAMPSTRDWAASPDLLLFLVSHIKERQPKTIVDLGSGASTIWMARAIRHFGLDSKVIALDHDAQFGAETEEHVTRLGLSGTAEVRIAPLVETEFSGAQWKWYDLKQTQDVDECDMLVIDGPPGGVQPLSRYPALPVFSDRLSADGIVVMDDSARDDEQEIVARWVREFPEWSARFLRHEKGTAVLKRMS